MSVAGNQNFTKVENSIVSASAINTVECGKMAPLQCVEGIVNPTAAGNYTLVTPGTTSATVGAAALHPVSLPAKATIMHVVYSSDVDLVGGTSIQAGLSASNGGGIVSAATTLSAAVPLVAVNNSVSAPIPAAFTGVTDANFYAVVATLGTFTVGTVRVKIYYLSC